MNPRIIDIAEPPYSADPDASDNSPAFQAAIDYLLANGGGVINVPPCYPKSYRLASTIGIDAAGDTAVKICLQGLGGRRLTQLEMTTVGQPLFRLRTAGGNIRDFHMRDLHLRGGLYGIELKDDAYNLVENCTFSHQTGAAIWSQNGGGPTTRFVNCWVLNLLGASVQGNGGSLLLSGCVFGESVGGFRLVSTALRMTDCQVHDASSDAFSALNEGKALFRLEGGSSLQIEGGHYRVRADVNTFIYNHRSRDILINGGVFELLNCTSFIANNQAHSGTKPYPILAARPLRVSSRHPTVALALYRQLDSGSGHAVHCHQDALIDCGATEYVVAEPFFHDDYLAIDKRNVGLARARLDRD